MSGLNALILLMLPVGFPLNSDIEIYSPFARDSGVIFMRAGATRDSFERSTLRQRRKRSRAKSSYCGSSREYPSWNVNGSPVLPDVVRHGEKIGRLLSR